MFYIFCIRLLCINKISSYRVLHYDLSLALSKLLPKLQTVSKILRPFLSYDAHCVHFSIKYKCSVLLKTLGGLSTEGRKKICEQKTFILNIYLLQSGLLFDREDYMKMASSSDLSTVLSIIKKKLSTSFSLFNRNLKKELFHFDIQQIEASNDFFYH